MRQFFGTHARLALLLAACVLFARIVIPTGFMPMATPGGIVVQMCTGNGAMALVVDASGKEILVQDSDGSQNGNDGSGQKKGDGLCAFSGLGAPSLAGADAALLAVALLFVLTVGLRPLSPPLLHSVRRLRPPLRGPPPGR